MKTIKEYILESTDKEFTPEERNQIGREIISELYSNGKNVKCWTTQDFKEKYPNDQERKDIFRTKEMCLVCVDNLPYRLLVRCSQVKIDGEFYKFNPEDAQIIKRSALTVLSKYGYKKAKFNYKNKQNISLSFY